MASLFLCRQAHLVLIVNMMVELSSIFRNAIKENETCSSLAKVYVELDWVVNSGTVIRPDISVACGGLIQKHITSSPAIVVEILSDSTRERDLKHKRSLYQTQGVPYYLIVDPKTKAYTQLKLENDTYQEVPSGPTASFTICETCTIEIPIAEALA